MLIFVNLIDRPSVVTLVVILSFLSPVFLVFFSFVSMLCCFMKIALRMVSSNTELFCAVYDYVGKADFSKGL